jgi:hypothetical protein
MKSIKIVLIALITFYATFLFAEENTSSKKNQVIVEVLDVKMPVGIDKHDFEVLKLIHPDGTNCYVLTGAPFNDYLTFPGGMKGLGCTK